MSLKMKGNKLQCHFRSEYLNEFPWVESVAKDSKLAKCKLCNCSISLSNMGRQALISHTKSRKHVESVKIQASTISITNALQDPSLALRDLTNTHEENMPPSKQHESSVIGSEHQNLAAEKPSQTSQLLKVPQISINSSIQRGTVQVSAIASYLNKEDVSRAEILWVMHTVARHQSLRDIESSVPMFQKMFPDSDIAKKIQISKSKASCMIGYGLKNYFQKELLHLVETCNMIVVGFDESMNSINKLQQMDIVIRFWDDKKSEVATRYFTSAFLGRTRASDLLKAFEDNIPKKLLQKIIQVSMDGPNVNLKFLKDLQVNLSQYNQDKTLIDIGSCSLHVLHNAFKIGIQNVKWQIVEFLRALFNLFNYSPARRDEYTNVTNSRLFPKSFCGVRWLENVPVAEKAQQMLPHVINYVNKMEKNKTVPISNSFKIVKEVVSDKLLSAKLAFFQSFAGEIEPFLTEFQSSDPKVPFLFDTLSSLYLDILKKIVKSEVLEKHDQNILKIDLKNENNLLTAEKTKLSIAVKVALKNTEGVSNLDKLQFKNDCRTIIKLFLLKVAEKSPLKYSVVKGVSCLDPSITLNTNEAEKRMSMLLEKFVNNNLINVTMADKIEKEFRQIINLETISKKISEYRRNECRLDHFWRSVLECAGIENYPNLFCFIKTVMIMSHGNAALERSFSINKECLVENQKQQSLIAQRVICDAINAMDGPLADYLINKKLIQEVRMSSALYKRALAEEKEKNEKTDVEERAKKRKAIEILELEEKRKKIIENAQKEATQIERDIQSLKKS